MQACGPYTRGEEVLNDILVPSSSAAFFETTWEKEPLFISRPSLRQWYSDWLSQEQIFDLLARKQLQYGFNLDVTTYNGKVRPAQDFVWQATSHSCKQSSDRVSPPALCEGCQRPYPFMLGVVISCQFASAALMSVSWHDMWTIAGAPGLQLQ